MYLQMNSIYLRHNGNCRTNGSYFTDGSIISNALECTLPGATLDDGEWIGPNGVVPCDGGNNQNVQCTTGSGASLRIQATTFPGAPGDGCWTALDSSDADGYVVNVTSDTDTVQTVQVEGSSNNTITLNGLRELTTYSITVRAYQQLLGPASTISAFTHCQQEGIYLGYNGNCYTNGSYFWDTNINGVTGAISCVLPGASLTTGQWVRVADPNDDPVDCNGDSASDPFRCTKVTSPDATINLYRTRGLTETTEGWYKCCLPTDCSDSNTNIIFANIFRFAEIESFTVADLPSDMTVYPQEYKLNCTKIGFRQYSISMSIGGTTLTNYPGSFCNDGSNSCSGTVLVSSSNTIRYTVTITWDGMTVSSGSISQSTTGDQMYQCRVADHPGAAAIRLRNITIKVPATAPSPPTEVNKTATTITVNWTALDSSDADGYVVNVTSDTDTVQTVQVEGSSNNTITLNGLRGRTTYSITVRAYQQLLGPASTISVQTLPVPSGWPSSIQVLPVNSTANNLTWNEVNCSERNGLITGYTVIISNSSITYNLTSTERYIILNDLVFGSEYNISVAAVNSVGRGPFSDPIEVKIGIEYEAMTMGATESTDLYTTINDAVKQDALYANVEVKNTNGGTGATPAFDPLIPKTCPVSISDLGTHVASYHSDTNAAFNQQYQGYREKRAFIIAQSPMENTVRDFWKMILDYKVSAIVMLCGEEDCCFPYWLSGRKYDEYGLEVTNEINSNGYTERMFKVSSDKEAISRNVLQLQVADWPQDGVVREPRTVLQVIDDVIHRQQKIGGGPVVVHCR
uniref:Protein-tyrosine-phosphatase n=1 Tax=Amphimedon queenslandica TaxID=400682 RepID=A0A1X7TQ11_AMPQE